MLLTIFCKLQDSLTPDFMLMVSCKGNRKYYAGEEFNLNGQHAWNLILNQFYAITKRKFQRSSYYCRNLSIGLFTFVYRVHLHLAKANAKRTFLLIFAATQCKFKDHIEFPNKPFITHCDSNGC